MKKNQILPIFEILPPIFFYDLLLLGTPPPSKTPGSPIIVLYRKSGKNRISNADR